MFKKLLLTLIIMSVATVGHAQLDLGDLVEKIPNTEQGLIYSIADSEFNYAFTTKVIEKNGFSGEFGYSTNGKILAAVSYDLIQAEKYVNLPILKHVHFQPGFYVAVDEIDSGPKWDYGFSATFISIPF